MNGGLEIANSQSVNSGAYIQSQEDSDRSQSKRYWAIGRRTSLDLESR